MILVWVLLHYLYFFSITVKQFQVSTSQSYWKQKLCSSWPGILVVVIECKCFCLFMIHCCSSMTSSTIVYIIWTMALRCTQLYIHQNAKVVAVWHLYALMSICSFKYLFAPLKCIFVEYSHDFRYINVYIIHNCTCMISCNIIIIPYGWFFFVDNKFCGIWYALRKLFSRNLLLPSHLFFEYAHTRVKNAHVHKYVHAWGQVLVLR